MDEKGETKIELIRKQSESNINSVMLFSYNTMDVLGKGYKTTNINVSPSLQRSSSFSVGKESQVTVSDKFSFCSLMRIPLRSFREFPGKSCVLPAILLLVRPLILRFCQENANIVESSPHLGAHFHCSLLSVWTWSTLQERLRSRGQSESF